MKTKFNVLILTLVLSGFSTVAYAQCPQICDGIGNTGLGASALISTFGPDNTGLGYFALASNTAGVQNTGVGSNALVGNSTGTNNTATGFKALANNSIGGSNTAIGGAALRFNTAGADNTAMGANALQNSVNGDNNIGLGVNAGLNLSAGSNNIEIGNTGVNGDSNRIRIGTKGTHRATFIAGIAGITIANGVGVLVNSQGQLGTVTSSARYKDDIQPMNKTSEALLSLQPVTFRYKQELDPEGIPQFGLVAEQVEKVNPDLVARDDQGKPYTVRYEAVNAMLLNEFLKEHKKVEDLQTTVTQQQSMNAEQQKEIEALTAALKEQAAQIQVVSDQLALRKPVPHLVANVR